MLRRWPNKYIGIEYQDKGRGPKYDCLGLVRAILMNEFNIAIPSFAETYQTADEYRQLWVREELNLLCGDAGGFDKVELPEEGDVILFKTGKFVNHCGVMYDHEQFVHIQRGKHACLGRIDDLEWKNKIEGYYRHHSRR